MDAQSSPPQSSDLPKETPQNPTPESQNTLTPPTPLSKNDNTSQPKAKSNKLVLVLVAGLVIALLVIAGMYFRQTKLQQSEVLIPPQEPAALTPLTDYQNIVSEIAVLDNFSEAEFDVMPIFWQKSDQQIRFVKKVPSTQYLTLHKEASTLADFQELLTKINDTLSNNSYQVDFSRNNVYSYDSGNFIQEEIWTNGTEYVSLTVGGLEDEGYSLTFTHMGDAESILRAEETQATILNEFYTLYTSEPDELKLFYTDLDANGEVKATLVLDDLNQPRFLTPITKQAGEGNFIYYTKNTQSNTINGIFVGNTTAFISSYTCEDMKRLNITMTELLTMSELLKSSYADFHLENLLNCQL
jgi:hypothetical protein